MYAPRVCRNKGLPSPAATRNAVGLLAGERHEVGFAMEMDRWTSGEVIWLSTRTEEFDSPTVCHADVAQPVESLSSKQVVASSILVVRSRFAVVAEEA